MHMQWERNLFKRERERCEWPEWDEEDRGY